MSSAEIELNPIDFITVGTIGPKGQREFYLQAGYDNKLVSLKIEKEQSWALSEAIRELIGDLDDRFDLDGEDFDENDVLDGMDMDLREPIEPMFIVSQMGLGYDEEQDKIVLVAQELVRTNPFGDTGTTEESKAGIVRIWCSREQMWALSFRAMRTVKSGRADPKQNGRLVYYWT